MEEDERGEGITLHFQALDLSPFSIHVHKNIAVLDLEDIIRERLSLEDETRVRMIFNGQVLEAGDSASDYGLEHNSNLLLALSERRHGRRNSLSDSSSDSDVEIQPPLRGFDRFRQIGFGQGDIERIRSQFYNAFVLNTLPHVYNSSPNSAHLRNPHVLRDVEEAFIENVLSRQARLESDESDDDLEELDSEGEEGGGDQDTIEDEESVAVSSHTSGGSTASDIRFQGLDSEDETEEGTYLDLFIGLMMGFLLSFTMLFFWFSDKSLSTRTKFGILAGVGCNLSFGLIHFSKSFE